MRNSIRIALACSLVVSASSLLAEQSGRDATREKLRTTLAEAGKLSDVRTSFRQSSKEPYNFVGTIEDGLDHAQSLEIVVRVTEHETINFRIYPHYKDGYINLDKAKDSNGLMRTMLLFSDHNFLYWGVDDDEDAFCGYTITLESGYPEEAIETVVRSIRNTDGFVGRLRPFIDGSGAK